MVIKPTLHLLMGLPGSGKSTLARTLETITGAVRVSSDDERLALFTEPTFSQKEHDNLYKILDHNVSHLLAAGKDVIYDANLNRLQHRQEKQDLAKEYNAKTILWFVEVPQTLARSRRKTEQDERLIPDGETSEKMFDRIAEVLEEPNTDEIHIHVDGTKITDRYVRELLETF